jgi:Delta carbonic anhydrase
MQVGQTYDIHWPHSAAGACGTVNQYQTPFYDGVFCNLDMEAFATLGPQDITNAVGVQAQIFTIVNDESYYYPDMIRGWIVDEDYDNHHDWSRWASSMGLPLTLISTAQHKKSNNNTISFSTRRGNPPGDDRGALWFFSNAYESNAVGQPILTIQFDNESLTVKLSFTIVNIYFTSYGIQNLSALTEGFYNRLPLLQYSLILHCMTFSFPILSTLAKRVSES